MSLPDINIHSPGTLAEAIKLLGELEGARILAGGTDILVDLKQGLTEARNIISLQKIEELKGIEKRNKSIRIGALTTPAELASDPLINQYFPALSDAAKSMASRQIRSMATIGGNIASAVPSADLPPSLIAGEATVELQCLDASRQEPISSFFTGPRETTCEEGEVLTFIHIPLPPPNTGISYKKFALREANALAVASVAARITFQGRAMTRVIMVLGAVAPTPVIAIKASEYLSGKEPSESLFRQAASIAKEESQPISDLRGSIWFRKELIEVLCQRALNDAWSRAEKKRKSQ